MSPSQRLLVLNHEPRSPFVPLRPPIVQAGQDDFDVLFYSMDVLLDVPNRRLEGQVTISFGLATGVTQLPELLLNADLARVHVTDARAHDGTPLQVNHERTGLLHVYLPYPVPESVTLDFTSEPGVLGFGVPMFGERQPSPSEPAIPVVASMSEANFSRGWWPCKDRPDDKAFMLMSVIAPSDLVVVSNGTRVGEPVPSTEHPGMSTTTWQTSDQISTYLVSLAVSNYETWQADPPYVSLDSTRTMPVQFWAYPERVNEAREAWDIVVPALQFFSQGWGEYPFLSDKYAHAMINFDGAMENQTAVSFGSEVTRADHSYDFLVVHEAAHHWWGDDVGPSSWESVWLNEGFATYGEALWTESRYGAADYRSDMRALDIYSGCGADFPGTVHSPIDLDQDGWPDGDAVATVYNKGAWVLHMLRWVLGQSPTGSASESSPTTAALFALLRQYRDAYRGRSASTDNFVSSANAWTSANGNYPSLDWFFQEWVQQPGRPHYEFGWTAQDLGNGPVVHVEVAQTQPNLFRMPVLIRMRMRDGSTVENVVWNFEERQHYELHASSMPVAVEWDPDDWVLKCVRSIEIDHDHDGVPDDIDGCPTVPNPFQEDVNTNGQQDACEPGLDFDQDGALNEVDCAPADVGAWIAPDDATTLRLEHAGGDVVLLSVAGLPDPLGQRAYSVDFTIGLLSTLKTDRDFRSAGCLAPGVAALDLPLREDLPVELGGIYYLAHAWNGCGPVMPGTSTDWLSICR